MKSFPQQTRLADRETESTLLVVVGVKGLDITDDVVEQVSLSDACLGGGVGELGEVDVEVVVGWLVVDIDPQLVTRNTILLVDCLLERENVWA